MTYKLEYNVNLSTRKECYIYTDKHLTTYYLPHLPEIVAIIQLLGIWSINYFYNVKK